MVGLIVAVAVWLGWCGRGWVGDGSDGDTATTADESQPVPEEKAPASSRCKLRVDASGVIADGENVEIADAVETCKPFGEAEVLVTGDAAYGTAQQLETALRDAGIRVYSARRTPPGD